MTEVVYLGGGAGYVVTPDVTYVYLNSMPGNFLPLCPYCLCCTWETRGWEDTPEGGMCIGHCHYEEAHDHPVVFGPYCAACLESHHGWVCPNLTATGVA